MPAGTVLRAGYQANATITVEKKDQVLVLPQGALHFDNGEAYVLLLNGKEGTKKQPVKIGLSNDSSAQIISGLSLGQKVVASLTQANAPS